VHLSGGRFDHDGAVMIVKGMLGILAGGTMVAFGNEFIRSRCRRCPGDGVHGGDVDVARVGPCRVGNYGEGGIP